MNMIYFQLDGLNIRAVMSVISQVLAFDVLNTIRPTPAASLASLRPRPAAAKHSFQKYFDKTKACPGLRLRTKM